MLPLVIGLLATKNRPKLAHRAAHLFFEQGYSGPKNLVIYDDGLGLDNQVQLCQELQNLPNIDVVKHESISLPAKRNRMVATVNDPNAIYFMWDDDDYHGVDRVSRQVAALLDNPQAQACLLEPFTYYNQITNQVRLCKSRTADATIAFKYQFWAARSWDESIDPGSGYRMIAGRDSKLVTKIPAQTDYVVTWHGSHRFPTAPVMVGPNWKPALITKDQLDAWLILRDCG